MILQTCGASVLMKLHAGDTDRSLVERITRDTLMEGQSLQCLLAFPKIGRGQNSSAHELAHLAIRLSFSHSSPPDHLCELCIFLFVPLWHCGALVICFPRF